jgi:hypothetical protein
MCQKRTDVENRKHWFITASGFGVPQKLRTNDDIALKAEWFEYSRRMDCAFAGKALKKAATWASLR